MIDFTLPVAYCQLPKVKKFPSFKKTCIFQSKTVDSLEAVSDIDDNNLYRQLNKNKLTDHA